MTPPPHATQSPRRRTTLPTIARRLAAVVLLGAGPSSDARAQCGAFAPTDPAGLPWTAASTAIERRVRVERGGRAAVDVRLLLRPEHARQADRLAADVRTALVLDDRALAPYPPASLTLVDLPWRSPYAGTVLPGLVAITTPWLEPARATDAEASLARGLARHFWPDEGVARYAASRLLEHLVQRQLDSTNPNGFLTVRFFGGLFPYVIRSVRFNEIRLDPSALALQTLERHLGRPSIDTVMAEYERRFSCGRPSAHDFLRLVESVSGRDLQWFFDQTFSSPRTFDYAVDAVTSEAARPPARYRSTIVVGRRGDGVFSGTSRPPVGGYQSGRGVEIQITFADGTVRRETWDGRARSTSLVYDSAAPVSSVIVDPDEVLALDVHRTNNTWTRAPRGPAAATYWAARWAIWAADLLLGYGFFV